MTINPEASILRVITIEDSLLIVDRIREIVQDVSGVAFLGNALNYASGIELIHDCLPDVIFVDIHLCGLDGKSGIDLLHSVRALHPEMLIIMLTNLTENKYRVLCQEGGADLFFDKSNDFDKIPDTLNQLILQKRSPG